MRYTSDNFLKKESKSRSPTNYGTFYSHQNKTHTKFPSITFNNTTSTFQNPGLTHNSFNKTNKSKFSQATKTMNNFYKSKENPSSPDKKTEQELSKVVYSRKAYINKLGLVDIVFIINDNKFFITVDPLGTLKYVFTIVFYNEYEINKLQSLYKNYEQVIHDIVYDGISINFSKKIKKHLNYVRIFFI